MYMFDKLIHRGDQAKQAETHQNQPAASQVPESENNQDISQEFNRVTQALQQQEENPVITTANHPEQSFHQPETNVGVVQPAATSSPEVGNPDFQISSGVNSPEPGSQQNQNSGEYNPVSSSKPRLDIFGVPLPPDAINGEDKVISEVPTTTHNNTDTVISERPTMPAVESDNSISETVSNPPEEARKWIEIIREKKEKLLSEKSEYVNQRDTADNKIKDKDREIAELEKIESAFNNAQVTAVVEFMEKHKNEAEQKITDDEKSSTSDSEKNDHSEHDQHSTTSHTA